MLVLTVWWTAVAGIDEAAALRKGLETRSVGQERRFLTAVTTCADDLAHAAIRP